MFQKHRKTASMGILQCCVSDSFQSNPIRLEREENRLQKISLRQLRPAKAPEIKTPLHKKTVLKDNPSFFQILNPKISFTYSSPRNISQLKKTVRIAKNQPNQFQEDFSVRTASRTIKEQKTEKQEKQGIFVPPKLQHMSQKSEEKLEKTEEIYSQKDVADDGSSRTKRVKGFTLQQHSTKTLAVEREETKKKSGKQSQIEFQHSLVMKQDSQRSKSSSLERPKGFSRSQNMPVMKKPKKAMFFTNSNQFGQKLDKPGTNKNASKLVRQGFKKGKLFERLRRIETKFSEDDQSSSSHHSEVIQDYKSLLSKLQSNRLQDQTLIEI